MTGLGEIELLGKLAGDGREEVGLASLAGDEDWVPWNNSDAGRSWDRLCRKGLWGATGVSGEG